MQLLHGCPRSHRSLDFLHCSHTSDALCDFVTFAVEAFWEGLGFVRARNLPVNLAMSDIFSLEFHLRKIVHSVVISQHQ